MRNLLLLFLILSTTLNYAQDKIKWMTMNEALEAQKESPKKLFMDVYTTWCGPCKLLDKNTLSHKDVIAFINKNYYAVKFNAEGNEEITFEDFTDLSNRVDTLLDIFITDTKPEDDSCISGTLVGQRRNNE